MHKVFKTTLFSVSFFAVLGFVSTKYVFLNSSSDSTVMGVAHSLACPCECPMVLEDCHMSCGLSWKNGIGAQLKEGLVKDEIVGYFYKRYGREALLTPAQRVSGKWYQVTRGGYPVKDMILFVLIVLVWTFLINAGSLAAIEKIQARKINVP
tara:strand:+ start:20637 stop:21092 length:456 start_codon:yes stop_codon:yes gene_type:complete